MPAARIETLRGYDPEALQQLRTGHGLHMRHLGASPLGLACLESRGLSQRLVALGEGEGRCFDVLDASGGYASACLGSGHPLFARVFPELWAGCGQVTAELGSLERSRFLLEYFGPGGHWADRFPGGEYQVSGRNSGSEGMELALRLVLQSNWDSCRWLPLPGREGRNRILVFEGAWHGWTCAAQALLNRRQFRVGLPGSVGQGPYGFKVSFLPFGEPILLEAFFAEHGHELAAVLVEPIQGDAGILVPPAGYLRELAELCLRDQVALVADEVLTFARTGRFFAMTDEHGPIPTDITIIGKSVGFGFEALSLVIARNACTVRPSGAMASRDLRPLTCGLVRAGLAWIQAEGLLEHSRREGLALGRKLAGVAAEFPGIYREARGVGFLHGMELTRRAAARVPQLRRRLMENGVYVEFVAGAGRRSHGLRTVNPTLRVAPPLIATAEELERIVAAIRAGSTVFLADLK